MKHCFSYGANMDLDKMFDRCPNAKFIEEGELKGYRFIINTHGVASIVPDEASSVSGIIWKISEDDEAFLDHFEGVKGGWYTKHTVAVGEIADNTKVYDCLVYVASDSKEGKPIEDYFTNIIKWAKNYHFSKEYIIYLESLKGGKAS
jgi:gamma-glutamylcyclotransferase (GGCT)/AIG2-like uncharacterized protein YtfP